MIRGILIENKIKVKNTIKFFIFFSNSLIHIFLHNFSTVFRRFFSESFQYLFKRVSLIPLTMPEYNCVPSVESITLMPIIEAKMGQTLRVSKCATFIRLSALLGLESNYDLHAIVLEVLLIKSHFKIRIQTL